MRKKTLGTIVSIIVSGAILASCSPAKEETLVEKITPTKPAATETIAPVPDTPEPVVEIGFLEALVIEEQNVYGGPGTMYGKIATVFPGDVLPFRGHQFEGTWLFVDYDIKDGSGKHGWIYTGDGKVHQLSHWTELPYEPYHPLTGIMKGDPMINGYGVINLSNFSLNDIEVILVKDGEPLMSIYVRVHEEILIPDIPYGEYDLYFDSGGQWDGEKFTVMSGYGEKADFPYVFSEETPRHDIDLTFSDGGSHVVPDSEYPFIDYKGDGGFSPAGIEGIDYPIISNGVDFLFDGVYLRRFFHSGDIEIVPEPPYNLIAIVSAESKNYTSDFPCGSGYEAAGIELVYNMPETSRGGSRWLHCMASDDGSISFVFPTYAIATDYSILLPGEPPFVLQVDLDSILDRAEW